MVNVADQTCHNRIVYMIHLVMVRAAEYNPFCQQEHAKPLHQMDDIQLATSPCSHHAFVASVKVHKLNVLGHIVFFRDNNGCQVILGIQMYGTPSIIGVLCFKILHQ